MNGIIGAARDRLDLCDRLRIALREAAVDTVEKLTFRLRLLLAGLLAVILQSLDHAIRREEHIVVDIDS